MLFKNGTAQVSQSMTHSDMSTSAGGGADGTLFGERSTCASAIKSPASFDRVLPVASIVPPWAAPEESRKGQSETPAPTVCSNTRSGVSGMCLAVLCCHGMHVSDRADRSGFSFEHQPSAGAAFRYGLTDTYLHILAPRPTVIHHHPGPLRALRILPTLRAGHLLIQSHLQPSLIG